MGTVTFQNTDTMLRMSSANPVGTIAFILDEEAILVRVNKGWQYIAVKKQQKACDLWKLNFLINFLFYSLELYYHLQRNPWQQRPFHRLMVQIFKLQVFSTATVF